MGLLDFFRKESPVATKQPRLLEQVLTTRTPDFQDQIFSLYNPNKFISRKDFDKIDEMLRDEQIFGILEMKKNFVLSTGYQFSLPEEAPGADDLLKFVEDNFNVYYRGLLNTDFYGILSAMEYGFSFSEKIFEKIEDKLFMVRIRPVPPHSIEFASGEMGELTQIIQRQPGKTVELIKWKDKFVIFTNTPRFDNPYGRSDLERCYTYWYAKKQVVKFWAMHLEKYASPIPVMKVPGEFGEDRVDEMIKIMESFRVRTVAVVPEDTELDFLKANGASEEYDKAIERFNQMIGRGLLVPDLLGFGQSTNKGGSNSLGRTQMQIFLSVMDYYRATITEIMNDQVIKPLIDINFGTQEIYPEFSFKAYEDEQLQEYLKIYIEAIKGGMPTNVDDYNYLRRSIGFPELDEEAEVPAPKAPQNNDMPEPEEDLKKKSTRSFKALRRKPNKFEARIDFIEQDETKRKKEDSSIEWLEQLYSEIRDSFIKSVIKRNIITEGKVKELKNLSLDRWGANKSKVNAAKISLKRDLTDIYNFGWDESSKDIKRLEKQQNFAKISDTQIKSSTAQRLAKELIDEVSFDSLGTFNEEIESEARFIIRDGIEKGLNEKEVVSQLSQLFETKAPVLETIVRTNSTNVFNQATQQVGDTEAANFVDMWEYSAILDDRTTDICEELDGFKAKRDDPIWLNISPPNHFNCRSRLVPITVLDVEDDPTLKPDRKPSLNRLRKLPGVSQPRKNRSFI